MGDLVHVHKAFAVNEFNDLVKPGKEKMKNLLIGLPIVFLGCFSNKNISWESKRGWVKCKSMIRSYPHQSAPSCWALHMCANEAPLSKKEYSKLIKMFKDKPECDLP